MRSSVLALALLLGGCAFDWDRLRPLDAAADVRPDPIEEARSDTAIEEPVEMDGGADVPPDLPVDLGVDAGFDVPADRGFDAGFDVPADRGFDAGFDVRPDTGVDVGVDVPPCVGAMCPCSMATPMGYCRPGEACTAGACVAGTMTGALIITEIMNDPMTVADDVGEWFEVYNPGPTLLDLRGLRVTDTRTDEFTIPTTLGAPVLVPSHGYVVLARNGSTSVNGGVTAVHAYGTAYDLGNPTTSTNDSIILDLGAGTTTIDRATYDNTWPHTSGHSKSLRQVTLDATARAMAASWCSAPTQWVTGMGDYGTPGRANDCP